jgi:hypothetical protein
MFGVRHDKKNWICGDGLFKMASSGSGNFCMSKTDRFGFGINFVHMAIFWEEFS